jgi:hypothetical protein
LEKLLEDADLETACHIPGGMSTDGLGATSPMRLPDSTFNFPDDIFGTDMTMPSSPPLFDLGDDSTANNALWSDFLPSTPDLNNIGYNLDIFEDIGTVEGETTNYTTKDETSSVAPTPTTSGARVDFSSFIDDATKIAVNSIDT